jgi:hypothetical protein
MRFRSRLRTEMLRLCDANHDRTSEFLKRRTLDFSLILEILEVIRNNSDL